MPLEEVRSRLACKKPRNIGKEGTINCKEKSSREVYLFTWMPGLSEKPIAVIATSRVSKLNIEGLTRSITEQFGVRPSSKSRQIRWQLTDDVSLTLTWRRIRRGYTLTLENIDLLKRNREVMTPKHAPFPLHKF
jgi:hypothetical protein